MKGDVKLGKYLKKHLNISPIFSQRSISSPNLKIYERCTFNNVPHKFVKFSNKSRRKTK